MNSAVDTKRVFIFLAFAFGIAWLTGLVIYLTGGIYTSRPLFPGSPVLLSIALMSTFYMWAPAAANILTRLMTRDKGSKSYLHLHFRKGWPYWLAAWLLPALLVISGAAIFYLFFPQYFDQTFTSLRLYIQQATGQPAPANLWPLLLVQTLEAVIVAPILNGLFTFGEEFGWRAYLLPKLLPLGGRKAALLTGVIWGIWHWPVIAMGYNYGFNYFGAPWTGMLAMVWFTVLVGTFQAWVTLRGDSVWPAVIGHGAINGIAGISALFTVSNPPLLLGPAPIGVIASLPWLVAAIWILFSPLALQPRPDELPGGPQEGSQAGEL